MLSETDRKTLVVVGPAVALALFAGLTALAATRDDPAVWFTAIGAWVAFVAVLIALVVLYTSQVLEKPNPQVWIERPTGAGRFARLDNDVVVSTALDAESYVDTEGNKARGFKLHLRVHVKNEGRAVLRWGILNIQVPTECTLRALSPAHSVADTTFESGELYPGRSVACRCSVAERDYYPPGHSFLYVLDVWVPRVGSWPVAAVLDGFPATNKMKRAWTRVMFDVSEK